MNKVQYYVNLHLKMISEVINSTMYMLNYAKNDDVERLDLEAENRERLVNTINYIQVKLDGHINLLKSDEVTQELIDIINEWQEKMSSLLGRISELDNQIIEVLAELKTTTISEIASVYKNKNQLKGYNLNKTK